MISAGAIGAASMFAPLAGIAPQAVRRLWDLCVAERYPEARPVQEALAALHQAVKTSGVAALKSGQRHLQRECGQPRAPVEALDAAAERKLFEEIGAIALLRSEPRGW